jgi:alpha-glucosidase
MSWDPSTWDVELQAWYKELVRLRRTSTALIDGGFQVLLVETDTLIFQRDTDEEIVLVAAYRGEGIRASSPVAVTQGAIRDGVVFEELYTHQRATVTSGHFPLPALSQGAQVWVGKNIC